MMVTKTMMMTVTIQGDVWQPDATRQSGPSETESHYGAPDLNKLLKDYELRHGRCSSFTVKIVK